MPSFFGNLWNPPAKRDPLEPRRSIWRRIVDAVGRLFGR
jgi:hypothetical protein